MLHLSNTWDQILPLERFSTLLHRVYQIFLGNQRPHYYGIAHESKYTSKKTPGDQHTDSYRQWRWQQYHDRSNTSDNTLSYDEDSTIIESVGCVIKIISKDYFLLKIHQINWKIMEDDKQWLFLRKSAVNIINSELKTGW